MIKKESLLKKVTKFTLDDFKQFVTYDIAKEYYKDFSDEDFKKEVKENDILCILLSQELAKSLDIKTKSNKTFKVVHDVNYAKSNRHKNSNYVFKETSLIDSADKRALHFYLKCNVKQKKVATDICFSCNKNIVEIINNNNLNDKFTIKYDSNNKAKTCVAKMIDYDNIVDTSKLIIAILNEEYNAENSAENSAE